MTNEELRNQAISELSAFIESLEPKKGRILSYWVKDYVRFLKKEFSFNPKKLIAYKRGSIVKAHLGYRIGSEEGGLHYAVVIDRNNVLSDPTVRIIPLTSVKGNQNPAKVYSSNVFLGDEVYRKVVEKLAELTDECDRALTETISYIELLNLEIKAVQRNNCIPPSDQINVTELLDSDKIRENCLLLTERLQKLQKGKKELEKMKYGSIALIGQITTISKIRIYDPIYPSDTLNRIRLSNDSLAKIDAKIKELYTYEK